MYSVQLCTVHVSSMGVLLCTVYKYNPLVCSCVQCTVVYGSRFSYGGIVVYSVQVESFSVQLCIVYCCVRFTFPLWGYCCVQCPSRIL